MDENLVKIDKEIFQKEFNKSPFLVEHCLSDHPLLKLPRLLQLCRELPKHRVEYNSGNLNIDQQNQLTPLTGLSPEDTIRNIEECGSWLVLKNVERDPQYRDLLHKSLKSLVADVPGMHALEGFVFVSSPHAITPYHMDPEHNILLQVKGTKQVNIYDQEDRELVSAEQLEKYYGGPTHRNMKLQDDYYGKEKVFNLAPGMGLHFPVTAPHWVSVGPDVSISFSVTFRSELSRRQSVLHYINGRIRRMGMKPSPIGQSHLRDNSKYLAYQAIHSVKSRITGRKR